MEETRTASSPNTFAFITAPMKKPRQANRISELVLGPMQLPVITSMAAWTEARY